MNDRGLGIIRPQQPVGGLARLATVRSIDSIIPLLNTVLSSIAHRAHRYKSIELSSTVFLRPSCLLAGLSRPVFVPSALESSILLAFFRHFQRRLHSRTIPRLAFPLPFHHFAPWRPCHLIPRRLRVPLNFLRLQVIRCLA